MHIADAIEFGLQREKVRESNMDYVSGDGKAEPYKACALGFALIGTVGDVDVARNLLFDGRRLNIRKPLVQFIADFLGVDWKIAQTIENRHLTEVPVSYIAAQIFDEFPEALLNPSLARALNQKAT